jgi:hypothetical protein
MVTLFGVMALNIGLVLMAGSAQACRRVWIGFAVIVAFLGTLAVAGCSSSSPSEQPAGPARSAGPAYLVKADLTGHF